MIKVYIQFFSDLYSKFIKNLFGEMYIDNKLLFEKIIQYLGINKIKNEFGRKNIKMMYETTMQW